MYICGMVTEYNPLHNGHLHHIDQTRARLGADTAVVACMSGNWVQRGQAALLPKHVRARAALEAGVDLVIELPAARALRSAEGFAQNAVGLLAALGVVTHLSFGAERDDLGALWEVARTLLEHETVRQTLAHLQTGLSYAAARERALYDAIQERAAIIQSPNNILAVEYLKALIRLGSAIEPLAVARAGCGHDSPAATGRFASASYLRAALAAGEPADALAPHMPPASLGLLREAAEQGLLLADTGRLEAMMLSALRRQTPQSLAGLADVSEGLEHRLYAALRREPDLPRLIAAAKTRRYPEARIRRLLACAFLGLTREAGAGPAAYIRVLGATARGRQVLRLAAKRATLPLITKPAHVSRLPAPARDAFEREALATDLYHLALPAWRGLPPGEDWRAGVVFPGRSG